MRRFILVILFLLSEISFSQTLDSLDMYGRKQGIWHYRFSENSDSIVFCSYFNDTLEGNYYGFVGERLAFQTSFKKGKKNGIEKVYNSKRQNIISLKVFQYDSIIYIANYSKKGKLEYECEYKNLKKDGHERAYRKNGKVFISKEYKNGEQDGMEILYKLSGKIKAIFEYTNGKLISSNQ